MFYFHKNMRSNRHGRQAKPRPKKKKISIVLGNRCQLFIIALSSIVSLRWLVIEERLTAHQKVATRAIGYWTVMSATMSSQYRFQWSGVVAVGIWSSSIYSSKSGPHIVTVMCREARYSSYRIIDNMVVD